MPLDNTDTKRKFDVVGTRPLRMPPIRPGHIPPPLPIIGQARWPARADKDHGACHQHIIGRTGSTRRQLHTDGFPVGLALGRRYIASLPYELGKLVIRDFSLVHPESVHNDTMPRLGIRKLIRTHPEFTAWNPDHARGYGTWWLA